MLLFLRVGYPRGTREPGSYEIFRLTRNVGRNSRVFVTNLTGRYFMQNKAKSSCQTNAFLQTEDIFLFHRKHFLATRRFFVIGRNFLSQEEISCHRKKFLVTGRNVLSQEEISCHRKKFLVIWRYFLSQEEISCHSRKFPIPGAWGKFCVTASHFSCR